MDVYSEREGFELGTTKFRFLRGNTECVLREKIVLVKGQIKIYFLNLESSALDFENLYLWRLLRWCCAGWGFYKVYN